MDYELDSMKQLFLDLVDDLRQNILTETRERVELTLIELYIRTQNKREVMQDVIEKVLPQKEVIMRRDIQYFSDNRDLFAGLPEDRIHYYGEIIINSTRVSDEDIDTLWAYLDAIVDLAESYHERRMMYHVGGKSLLG